MNIRRALVTSALVLAVSGCSNVTVEGTVVNETYEDVSGFSASQYSFSMDTDAGIKKVHVSQYEGFWGERITVEHIRDLLEKGTKVKVDIDKDDINKSVYFVSANMIDTE